MRAGLCVTKSDDAAVKCCELKELEAVLAVSKVTGQGQVE
jgi:hypothetical protein